MKLIFNLFILTLFIPLILSNEDHDYSQMFMVCSPVYSRIELQKILETSVNSLAFQIPVKPLHDLKQFNSFNKSNLNIQNNNQNNNQNNQNLKINQNRQNNDVKLENRHKTEDKTPTIYLTTTTESTTTVEPSTTILSTTKLPSTTTSSTTSTTTTTTTTTAIPSTSTTTTTTQSPTTIYNPTTIASTTQSTITHKPRSIFPIKPSNKRYGYYKSQTAVPNPYVTTDLPIPAELNTNKPSLAKIRSRLFNLFQPRPFNSNLHKPRGPDYLNNLNTNSIQQSSTTTTTVESIENKSISSTESYPQIQSSIIPDSLNSEQPNLKTTTSSSLDLGRTNDNLLAVASSSRFHSVLNSNEEKSTIVDKVEEKINDKKEITELKTSSNINKADDLKDIKNEKHDKIETSTPIITGPLKLDEIFADFIDNNDTLNEKNIDSNPINMSNDESNKNENINDKKEDNNANNQNMTSSVSLSDKILNENTNETAEFINYDNSKEIDFTTESILDDELIVKKITEVIEADELKNQKNDNEEDKMETDKNLSTKNDSTDNEKSISNEQVNSKQNDNLSKGQLIRNVDQDNTKLVYDKMNEFIEVPTTGSKIDKSINNKKIVNNSKNITESINDKKTDKLTEIVNKEKSNSTISVVINHETTTNKPTNEIKTEKNKLNTYTYPIEYMIKDYLN